MAFGEWSGETRDINTTEKVVRRAVPRIEDTLIERGASYGNFKTQAKIAQSIKRAMQDSPNWKVLPDEMKEALEMDANKTARILNGDPFHKDSWVDKEGYIHLVSQELKD